MLSLSFLLGGEVAGEAHEAVMRAERSNTQKHCVKSEGVCAHHQNSEFSARQGCCIYSHRFQKRKRKESNYPRLSYYSKEKYQNTYLPMLSKDICSFELMFLTEAKERTARYPLPCCPTQRKATDLWSWRWAERPQG